MTTELGRRLLEAAEEEREALVGCVAALASLESPSDVPATQTPIQAYLTEALRKLGFRVRKIPGIRTGGHLLAVPRRRVRGRPVQLLLGHCDTVWPLGTLKTMPVVLEGDRLLGPGVFDMKGGLGMILSALRVLGRLSLEPRVTPVILINSDEELGSPESARPIRRLARVACRVFVPEPGMGDEGALKTARKGVGRYTLHVRGKASHAGLDPGSGVSAILELAHQVQVLHALTEMDRGITVNVGVVEGGTRPNVVAAEAKAEIDVRVLSAVDAREVETRILALRPWLPGATLRIERGDIIPPLERTSRNRALWNAAGEAARELGIDLEEDIAGGGSDGNTTSQITATLDGLGAVGDGAHAAHEFLYVSRLVERSALLARLLLLPP